MKKSIGKNRKLILRITMVGVVSAVATLIYMLFPEFLIVPGVQYMKIDLSDFPALLLASVMGPAEGIAVGIIKNLIHLTRTTTFGIGEIMNIGVIAAMSGSLYGFSKMLAKLFKKERFSPLVYFPAAILTVGVTVLAGWVLNAVFTPIFFMISGIPITTASIWLGVTGSTLLNVVKGALNVLPFYPIYLVGYKTYHKLVG